MGQSLPSVSGEELIQLLEKDGWVQGRRTTHGISMSKVVNGERKVTTIPTKSKVMPEGTLMAILGSKQTGLMRKGFIDLYNRVNPPKGGVIKEMPLPDGLPPRGEPVAPVESSKEKK